MSGLILCGRTSSFPLYIKSADINLYSLEELCYYLCNNIYEIDAEFFDSELISFLKDGLGLDRLVDELKNKIRLGENYMSLVRSVIESSNYYSEDEKKKIISMFEELSTKSVTERIKLRADMMLKREKFGAALHDYKAIIGKRYPAENLLLVANVWNNMGVAYTKLFMYRDAFHCFKLAYDLDKKQEYLDNYLCCAIFAREYARGCEDIVKEAKNQYGIDDETIEKYNKAIELAREDTLKKPEVVKMLNKLEFSAEKDLVSYGDELMDIIGQWKKEYREQL